MAGTKIRVGIIGANIDYGWGARAHLPALKALPEYELVGICTTRRGTAEETARRFGIPLIFTDYRDLVKQPDIDLVAVSVRAPLHHDMVMTALRAGKHVYCEWPLGANLKEAEESAALAREKNGLRQMVGLQARFAPPILRLKELVGEGFVGQPVAVTMTMLLPGILERASRGAWAADKTKGAHALSISAGHALDALCFCLGEFQELTARVGTQVSEWTLTDTGGTVHVTSPDYVMLQGTLASGIPASVHIASVPWQGSGWRLEVYGREGTVIATAPQMVQLSEVRLLGARKGEASYQEISIPDRLTWVPGNVPKGAPFNVAQAYRQLSRGILGEHDVEPSFATALLRHRLLAAVENSSARGTSVRIP